MRGAENRPESNEMADIEMKAKKWKSINIGAHHQITA